MDLSLELLPAHLAICRLSPTDPIPDWAGRGFFSITRSERELSIVCEQQRVPGGVTAERGWRALRVRGTLDFSQVGVLAALTEPLAGAAVSIFAISTFDTDYLLVREPQLPDAIEALRRAGHEVNR